ncbi:hypothetical protein MASR2M48_20950 [Spirochaetota bacterium]
MGVYDAYAVGCLFVMVAQYGKHRLLAAGAHGQKGLAQAAFILLYYAAGYVEYALV